MNMTNVKQYQTAAKKILARRHGETVVLPDPVRKTREEQMKEAAERILKRRGIKDAKVEVVKVVEDTDPYSNLTTKDLKLLLEERGVEFNPNSKRKKLIQLLKDSEL